MNARITDGTREGYERGLVKVMLWAFDNLETYPDFFTPSTLEILKAAHLKDKARKTKAGRPSKKRDCIRDECFKLLRAIVKGDESTFPIHLENITW